MKYMVHVLLAVVAGAVSFAAPAAASEDDFVRELQTRYVFLSEQQHKAGDRLQCCVSRIVSPRTGGLADADGQPAGVTIHVP